MADLVLWEKWRAERDGQMAQLWQKRMRYYPAGFCVILINL
jgi:hypothetical protein